MVTPIRDILTRSAAGWGIEPAARLAHARRVWALLVGPELAKVSRPMALQRKVLIVGVMHQVAGQEVRLRRTSILAALTKEFGETTIHDVRPVPRRRLSESPYTPRPDRDTPAGRPSARKKPSQRPGRP